MLTAEIKVNGCLAVHVYCHNTGIVGKDGDVVYVYEVYRVNVREGGQQQALHKSTVAHNPKDGAEGLIYKILGRVIGAATDGKEDEK